MLIDPKKGKDVPASGGAEHAAGGAGAGFNAAAINNPGASHHVATGTATGTGTGASQGTATERAQNAFGYGLASMKVSHEWCGRAERRVRRRRPGMPAPISFELRLSFCCVNASLTLLQSTFNTLGAQLDAKTATPEKPGLFTQMSSAVQRGVAQVEKAVGPVSVIVFLQCCPASRVRVSCVWWWCPSSPAAPGPCALRVMIPAKRDVGPPRARVPRVCSAGYPVPQPSPLSSTFQASL